MRPNYYSVFFSSILFSSFIISLSAYNIEKELGAINNYFLAKNHNGFAPVTNYSKERDIRDSIGNASLVTYQLYTKFNVNERQTLLLGDVQTLLQSHFNASWPVKIYCGGYCGYCDNGPMREHYFQRGDYNIIIVEWQPLAPDVSFVLSGQRLAGKHAAAFIDFLIDTTGVPLSAFHVNGHSAGAHVAGAIGLGYRERHDFKKILPRVTGLDPAAYIPDLNNIDDRIDPTDGAFVDIIHTDDGGAGITIQMGHADFFPNGGNHQAGCSEPDEVCCNHCRAFDLFDESITTEIGFVSYRCESYEDFKNGNCLGNDRQLMGESVSSKAIGMYYLDTNGGYPYAMG